MIRYRRSLNRKRYQHEIGSETIIRSYQHPRETVKSLGSGGSMVARLKLKEIDGRAHQEWSLRLNLTQRGEFYQVRTKKGLTD